MKMLRKDRVLHLLLQLTRDQYEMHKEKLSGISAQEIADQLKITRANASKELNQLVKEKKALKIKGKPVLFLAEDIFAAAFQQKVHRYVVNQLSEAFQEKVEQEDELIFELIGKDNSLKHAVEVAKSAVIYPPKGLPTLITGETGVGKSLFAEEMYKFGQHSGIFEDNGAFVVFNCADYVDNPQLLLSQLFGYVKGAFTGASENKDGLVEKARNGILFLDEIHRLPEEGQEMLFFLIDKGVYRKLGETEFTHSIDLMLIGATTENPSKVMLSTFLRRMPIMIQLPNLKERSVAERFELIEFMFNGESARLKKEVLVNKNVVKALLLYECKGNIGQLKSDIQVICARGFFDSRKQDQDKVTISLAHLPENIRESLIYNENKDEVIKVLSYVPTKYYVFTGEKSGSSSKALLSKNYFPAENDIYKKVSTMWEEMYRGGEPIEKITHEVNLLIEQYADSSLGHTETVQNQLLDPYVLRIVRKELSIFKDWSDKEEFEKYASIVTLHLQRIIQSASKDETRMVQPPVRSEIQSGLDEESLSFILSREILDRLSTDYGVYFRKIDYIYLTNFLSITRRQKDTKRVGLLVIMHGDSTASSMARFSNQLFNTTHVHAIDMSLERQVQDVLAEATEQVRQLDEGKGVLILADMGSIVGFEKHISGKSGIPVKTIDMISTPLLMEAVKKALSNETDLKHIYEYLIRLKKQYYAHETMTESGTSYFNRVLMDNLNKQLVFLDVKKTFTALNQILKNLLSTFDLKITDDIKVKFMFHSANMIERCILGETIPYKEWQQKKASYPEMFQALEQEFTLVSDQFGIIIPSEEIAYVFEIFEIQFPELMEHM